MKVGNYRRCQREKKYLRAFQAEMLQRTGIDGYVYKKERQLPILYYSFDKYNLKFELDVPTVHCYMHELEPGSPNEYSHAKYVWRMELADPTLFDVMEETIKKHNVEVPRVRRWRKDLAWLDEQQKLTGRRPEPTAAMKLSWTR